MGELVPRDKDDVAPGAPEDGAVFLDRRVLAFSASALCEALTAIWQGAGTGMRAVGVRFSTARQMIHVEVEMGRERLERPLRASELVPLLIGFCMGARVALPSRATKSVRVTSGGVVLDCIMHGGLPEYRRPRGDAARVLGDWGR